MPDIHSETLPRICLQHLGLPCIKTHNLARTRGARCHSTDSLRLRTSVFWHRTSLKSSFAPKGFISKTFTADVIVSVSHGDSPVFCCRPGSPPHLSCREAFLLYWPLIHSLIFNKTPPPVCLCVWGRGAGVTLPRVYSHNSISSNTTLGQYNYTIFK